jgi:hypothetical protein
MKPNSSSNQKSSASQYYSDADGKAFIRTFLKILYVLGILAGLYFCYLNINPYVKIVGDLLKQTDTLGFGQFISKIPIVGGIVRVIGTSSTWIFGVALWGLIQFVEVFRLVIAKDKPLMRTLLNDHDQSDKIRINENDDPVAAAMKTAYNKLPLGILRNMGKYRIAAYLLDLVICFTVYPPCEGGFLKFLLYVASGAFQRLNWANITLTIATLFAVEIILEFLFGVAALIYYYRKSRA